VVITRRHHPLLGQQFEVLQSGKMRITIRLKDGTSMRVPRHWTDADGDIAKSSSQHETALTNESMRRLFELVDAFSRR
jgi:hypothetical protein